MDVAWVVDFEAWSPSPEEWETLLGRVGEVEAERIQKFNRGRGVVGPRNPDARSSLLGRLMIAKALRGVLQVQDVAGALKRTKEGKPFVADLPEEVGSINFNVTHAGRCVAFRCCDGALVGTDVMEVAIVPKRPDVPRDDTAVSSFFDSLRDSLTPEEWQFVETPGTDPLESFFVLWTLKESFIKAVGVGLGYELHRIVFIPGPWSADGSRNASCCFDGSLLKGWAFTVRRLSLQGVPHILATAAGPFSAAIPSYAHHLPHARTGSEELRRAVANKTYETVDVDFLTSK